ncbi:DUF6461 domain-containing protein [Spirillospora sp. CA-253888]
MTKGEERRQAYRQWRARLHAWARAQGIEADQDGRLPEWAEDAYIEITDDDIDDILARLPAPPPPAYVWLDETPEWQAWHRAQTHALIWVGGVDPAEVLALYPAAEPLGEHRLTDLVEEGDGCGLAGGVRIGDWTLLYLPGDWRLASVDSVRQAPRISRELRADVVVFWQIGSFRDRFGYARDGDLKVEFEPLFLGGRHGSEPDLLTEQMSQAGLLPVVDGDPPDHSDLRALEVARLITGVHITPQVLNGRFHWALIPAHNSPGH